MRRNHAIRHHAGDVAAVARYVLDDGTGDMFQIRRGRQEQRLHVGELAIDQGHAQFGLIVAVLTQSLDDDRGSDPLTVVGDQPGGRSDLDIAATATCTSSKKCAHRSITSRWPAVTGSYDPGHTAIVIVLRVPRAGEEAEHLLYI